VRRDSTVQNCELFPYMCNVLFITLLNSLCQLSPLTW
jgi:hypothetical protein